MAEMKKIIASVLYILCLLVKTTALYVPTKKSPLKSTILFAEDPWLVKRSHVLNHMKRAIVGAATLGVFHEQIASAEEQGRTVELEIANLEGVEGNTGKVKIKLQPDWAPTGVKRFEELIDIKFYENCRMFRVLPGFVAQFGINGDPNVQSKWRSSSIKDDPVKVSNTRGTIVFATSGPNTRTTQIFVNTRKDGNSFLDKQGFSPFGEVIQGMDVVDKFYAGYGEGAPSGNGPNQSLIQTKGNKYLGSYPKLSYIKKASFID